MRIGIDAMGGDLAPRVCVDAAVQAVDVFKVGITLVGDKSVVKKELGRCKGFGRHAIEVVHAQDVVGMDELPSQAIRRKRKSSIGLGVDLVKELKIDAFVSAGNSGAIMAFGCIFLNRLKTIDRPALAVLLPSPGKLTVLLDAGANVDCKPHHLLQFAFMGSVYAEVALGITRPKVVILSNGEEREKGNELVKHASKLLNISGLNFTGNIEGRDLLRGIADVVVSDGFYGNIALKSMEGAYDVISKTLSEAVKSSIMSKFGGFLIQGPLKKLRRLYNYEEYGGAPLLGIEEVVVVAHGRSTVKALSSAIKMAIECKKRGVGNRIVEYIENQKLVQKLSTLYDDNQYND